MKLKTGLTRLAISALAITSVSCSHLKDETTTKREIASMNDFGIIGPDGKVLLYYGDRDFIVVKSCEPNTVLGKTPNEAKANCQGKFNRIPTSYFRMVLRTNVTNIGLNGLKPFTPDEAKAFGKYKITENQVELMKKQFANLPKEIERINAFIATYGPENAEGIKEELLSRQKSYEDYLSVLKKIDAEIEKGINFITDQTTLSLKKSSTDKEQFLYTVLKKFDPETKVPCGLDGTLNERIKDCSYQPDARKGKFVLLRRSKDFSEIYMNTRNGQLWSDFLGGEYPQKEATPACNNNPEIRGLLERTGYKWRAPRIEEYVDAEADGIKEALPHIQYWQWSESITGGLFAKERKGYLYSANDPKPITWNQDITYKVRCVSTPF
jgi:hypothetical protein